MKKMSVQSLVLLAILVAWSVIFRMIEVPLLPGAPFLKMDFSDFIVLIGMLIHGPIGILIIAVLRDVIWYFMTGGDMGIPIGEFMSIASSLAMFIPTYLVYKNLRTRSHKIKSIISGILLTLSLTFVLSLINYFIALPIYANLMNFPIDNYLTYVLSIIAPFNIIKGLVYAVGQSIVIIIILPILQKKHISVF